MDEMWYRLLSNTVSRIKNELLLFSIVALFFVVLFNQFRYWILGVYAIGTVAYTTYKIFENPREDKEYIKHFYKLLSTSTWSREFIDYTEIYNCDEDNSYQIETANTKQDFSQEWTRVFPDRKGSGRLHFYLKVNGVKIKEVPFVYCDGARIVVPMPQSLTSGGKPIFYWERDSLEWRMANVVGSFDMYMELDGVAKRTGVRVFDKRTILRGVAS